MVKIEWKDSFSVGIEEIDNQHMKLIQLINIFIDRYEKKNSNEILVEILQQIIQQFLYHVAYEENFIRREGIQISPLHKKGHEQTIFELKLLQDDFLKGKKQIDEKIINYFVELINHHVSGLDQSDFNRLKK